jgi:Flp pilus assembly protein TadB
MGTAKRSGTSFVPGAHAAAVAPPPAAAGDDVPLLDALNAPAPTAAAAVAAALFAAPMAPR